MVSVVRGGGRTTPVNGSARRSPASAPVSSSEVTVRSRRADSVEAVAAFGPDERGGGASQQQGRSRSKLTSESELLARSGFTAAPANPLEMLSCVLSLVTGGGRILFRNVEEALSLSPPTDAASGGALPKAASERAKLALRAVNGYKNRSEDSIIDVDVRG
ncbi:MAG: hypothetical protein KTR21_07475 [Rhodobacteraceae bacterium]|nr:hypothetical protein [Paracoccaceae bacterium]